MSKRSNLWVFIIYPGDSCPKDYIDIIQNWHIPCLLSPLHDADKNADLSEKKVHQHVMLDFGSGQNKSYDQVKEYADELKGTIPIICHNKNAMVRYFVHLDNPEKVQYKIEQLKCFSGFEYDKAFETYTNEACMYRFIENIIYENMIYNYAYLVRYMIEHGLEYELMFLRRHSIHFKCILDGYFQLLKNGRTKYVQCKDGTIKYEINDLPFDRITGEKKD